MGNDWDGVEMRTAPCELPSADCPGATQMHSMRQSQYTRLFGAVWCGVCVMCGTVRVGRAGRIKKGIPGEERGVYSGLGSELVDGRVKGQAASGLGVGVVQGV